MKYDKTLSQILEKEIKVRFRSVKQFSDKSGIPYMTISNVLKRGVENSSFGTIQRICEALNISMTSLFRGQALDTIQRKIIELGDKYTDEEIFDDLVDSKILDIKKHHYTDEEINNIIQNYRMFFAPDFP